MRIITVKNCIKIEQLNDRKKLVFATSVNLKGSIIVPVSYTHLDVYKRQVMVYLLRIQTLLISMAYLKN